MKTAASMPPPSPVDPAVRLDALFREAVVLGASDLLFEPRHDGLAVRLRVDGTFRPLASFPAADAAQVIGRVKVLAGLASYRHDVVQEGRFDLPTDDASTEVRASVLPTVSGEKLTLRFLRSGRSDYSLADLGINDAARAALEGALRARFGLVLFVGPAGSGKTTSQYAALRHVHTHRGSDAHYVSIEDPVEYRLPFVSQTEVNEEAGYTFPRGLRAVLRHNPDVLLIGEIRDGETASIALEAALTGHLILSTMHGASRGDCVARLEHLGVSKRTLAAVEPFVFSQRLVRTLCKHCREKAGLPPALARKLGIRRVGVATWRGTGCSECKATGYRGRSAIGAPSRFVVGRNGHSTEPALIAAAREKVEAGLTDAFEVARVLDLA